MIGFLVGVTRFVHAIALGGFLGFCSVRLMSTAPLAGIVFTLLWVTAGYGYILWRERTAERPPSGK